MTDTEIDHSPKSPKSDDVPSAKTATKRVRKPKAPKAPQAAKTPKAKRTAKPKAPKTAKADRPEPTTGQSGPKLDLDPKADRKEVGRSAALSDKESKVLAAIRASRSEDGIKIATIAEAAFPSKTKAQGNSWTRNSLRRLVCAKLVKRAGRGAYKKAA